MTDTPDISAKRCKSVPYKDGLLRRLQDPAYAQEYLQACREDSPEALAMAQLDIAEAAALSTADTTEAHLDPAQYSPDALGGANMRIDQLKAKLAAAEERIKLLELKIRDDCGVAEATLVDMDRYLQENKQLQTERDQAEERIKELERERDYGEAQLYDAQWVLSKYNVGGMEARPGRPEHLSSQINYVCRTDMENVRVLGLIAAERDQLKERLEQAEAASAAYRVSLEEIAEQIVECTALQDHRMVEIGHYYALQQVARAALASSDAGAALLERVREQDRQLEAIKAEISGDANFGKIVELLFYGPLREAEETLRAVHRIATRALAEPHDCGTGTLVAICTALESIDAARLRDPQGTTEGKC
jgi:hypothetical protein